MLPVWRSVGSLPRRMSPPPSSSICVRLDSVAVVPGWPRSRRKSDQHSDARLSQNAGRSVANVGSKRPFVVKLKRARRRVERACLPFEWLAGLYLRRLRRDHAARLQNASNEEAGYASEDYLRAQSEIREAVEGDRTDRLVRQARRYHIVPPEFPGAAPLNDDKSWERGPVSDEWRLRPKAFAELYREVEDAKARRRLVLESWAKILGGLITGLVALLSVIVSLVLALRS